MIFSSSSDPYMEKEAYGQLWDVKAVSTDICTKWLLSRKYLAHLKLSNFQNINAKWHYLQVVLCSCGD